MSWGSEARAQLVIDRAAARVPADGAIRGWARDKRVFVSSVIDELRGERDAAADGIRSVGAQPVMFEKFGGRDSDPVDAYLGEVETSQIYVGILGRSYGRPLPTRFSATHTEFQHAEKFGLRIAVWTLDTHGREGHQQSFLDEARTFHVVPSFRSPDDLRRQVAKRLREIAAEDLSPWVKLGHTLFRTQEIVDSSHQIIVTAQIASQAVAHDLEGLAPGDFGDARSQKFTWAGRCRTVQVDDIKTTTTSAYSQSVCIRLRVLEEQHEGIRDFQCDGRTPAELTEIALRSAVLREPNPLEREDMGFMAKMRDPLEPLRDAPVPDEIVRTLAEILITEELVGSGRAVRINKFMLGASVRGQRRLVLEWEPTSFYTDERECPRRVEGLVPL